ncbi:HTH domain-containing protein [bacterium]|nr:HTH domain-containing protein [bacterium]MDY3756811.1 sigma factor-like helix-turn-helix DNA-binding protein [Bacilli bacterium]
MEEIIYYSALFDYYQNLLTDVQRKYFEDYYFNNLSLQEIADSYDVSRNAISKTLKEIKEKLDYYESNLKLLGNNKKIRELLSEEDLKRIEEYI